MRGETENVVPGKVVELPYLEVFKKRGGVALRDMA